MLKSARTDGRAMVRRQSQRVPVFSPRFWSRCARRARTARQRPSRVVPARKAIREGSGLDNCSPKGTAHASPCPVSRHQCSPGESRTGDSYNPYTRTRLPKDGDGVRVVLVASQVPWSAALLEPCPGACTRSAAVRAPPCWANMSACATAMAVNSRLDGHVAR